MVSSISGASYNNPAYNTQNKQKPAQPTVEDYKKEKLAGPGMSLERFREILESDDIPIEEKLAETLEAFGSIITKEALESDIQAAKSGKMSVEELYRRSYARSWGRALTEDESMAMMKESQRIRRPEMFSGRNDPANLEKVTPIMNKVYAGKKLTPQEKSFLREYYPEAYEYAMRAEQEAERVKKAMENAKSPKEANRILMDAKMAAVSSNVNGSSQAIVQMLNNLDPKKSKMSTFDIQA